MPWISINELKRRSGYEERRRRRNAMPFGEYELRVCGNRDCGKKFKPTTPWQECCSKECRMHRAYLEGVLPKRRKAAKRK